MGSGTTQYMDGHLVVTVPEGYRDRSSFILQWPHLLVEGCWTTATDIENDAADLEAFIADKRALAHEEYDIALAAPVDKTTPVGPARCVDIPPAQTGGGRWCIIAVEEGWYLELNATFSSAEGAPAFDAFIASLRSAQDHNDGVLVGRVGFVHPEGAALSAHYYFIRDDDGASRMVTLSYEPIGDSHAEPEDGDLDGATHTRKTVSIAGDEVALAWVEGRRDQQTIARGHATYWPAQDLPLQIAASFEDVPQPFEELKLLLSTINKKEDA